MLTVIFDALHGESTPDGLVPQIVEFLLREATGKLAVYKTSSHLIIYDLRLRIVKGTLSKEDVQFEFNGIKIFADKFGQLSEWPKGFCDQLDYYLTGLCGWDNPDDRCSP